MVLTRFRQLYNKLTHSQAFKEDGPVDNSKINKSTFTPHNLKAILLGANGAIAVHYTTNSGEPKLVSSIHLRNGAEGMAVNLDEKWYRKNLAEDKGLIDALWFSDGLKFNYLEEIVFFTGGFTEEELNKEIGRMRKFVSNTKITTSMKRLKGILVVNGILTSEFESLNPKNAISKSLQDVGIPYEVFADLKPERTELGLLPNKGLDSKEYELDSQYSEDLPENEKSKDKYRLSRYFYEQTKRAEQAKKAKEEARKKQETIKYDYQLKEAVEATIRKLDKFYAPLWGKKYVGLIHKQGVALTHSNQTVSQMNTIIAAIYESWADIAFGKDKDDKRKDCKGIEDNLLHYSAGYIPGWHKAILADKEGWDKGKREKLKQTLLQKYSEYFDKDPQKINEIERGLTNCLVIKSCNKNMMILRITGITEETLNTFKKNFSILVGKTFVARKNDGLIASATIEEGVLNLTYIFSYSAFQNEVLFAYKQYEEGFKPSLQNALVGLKMDGRPLTVNLTDPRKMLISIIAGSRSGKGTMTMSLLSSIFGVGGSIIYLDNKPDIGAMLWDLEREYAAQGLKLLSLDMGSEYQEFTGATPVRTGALNLIDEDNDERDLFRTLRLAKMFQLVSFIGSHSSQIEKELGMSTKNLFFIVDELTSTNIDYTKLGSYAEKQSKYYEKKASQPTKATDRDKELADYYSKLNTILVKTPDYLTKGFAKDFGQSGLKIIVIGQQLNTGWKVAGTNFAKSFAGKLITNSHITFSGRLQATEDTFEFNPEQANLANRSGVFALADKIPAPLAKLDYEVDKAKQFTQFRSYFSLVKNDFNYDEYKAEGRNEYLINHPNRFTSQFLSGYVEKSESAFNDALKEIYDFEQNRNIDEISFSGLIKIMQRKVGMDDTALISNMNKGYVLVDAVFRKMNLGSYSCVEEYLCDCSPQSLFTQNELEERFNGVYKVEESDDGINLFAGDDTVLEDFSSPTTVDYVSEPVARPKSTPANKIDFEDTPKSGPIPTASRSKEENQYKPQNKQQVQDIPHNTQKAELSWAEQRRQDTMKEWQCYTGKIKIENSPFELYKSGSNTDALLSVKEMTRILREDIEKHIGAPNMITTFAVSAGNLFFNNIAYIPEFEESFIQTLPYVYQEKVRAGILADFFDLRTVYKYKNLNEFYLIDWDLAQGRARKEMGIGFRKKWNVLFKRFKYLNYIEIGQGDSIIYERDYPDSNKEDRFLDMFEKRPETTYSSKRSTGMLDRVWDSKPVRVITGAIGWTAGVQAVWLLASIMGPWGLLFGGLAAAGAYREYKNDSVNQARLSGTSSSNSGFSNVYDNNKNSGKKKKKK